MNVSNQIIIDNCLLINDKCPMMCDKQQIGKKNPLKRTTQIQNGSDLQERYSKMREMNRFVNVLPNRSRFKVSNF